MTLAKTPWYWETVTGNVALLDEWGEDFTIRHLVMPNHVECCTYPVLEWIAERMPQAPVKVMAQFHPTISAIRRALSIVTSTRRSPGGRHTENLMLHGAVLTNWNSNSKPPRSNAAMLSGSRRFWRSEGELAPAVALDLKR